MRNVFRLFVSDLRRMTSNLATTIIVLGLVLLPSLFSWFNIIACWDVFGNTGNLSIAVANVDDGYQSDLVPVRINVGDEVVSALRANDQMNWVFTDEEDAVDGARSGKYYAAVVIPESFSHDMMTFYTDEVEHAKIVYYSNEKRNAIAPKITSQGADQVSEQVNQIFTKTLTESALGIMSTISQYADDADLEGGIADLASHMGEISGQLSQSAGLLRSYGDLVQTSSSLIESSAALLQDAKTASEDVASIVDDVKGASDSIISAMDSASALLSEALSQFQVSFDDVEAAIDSAFDMAVDIPSDASAQLRSQASALEAQAASLDTVAGDLQQMADSATSSEEKALLQTYASQLSASADSTRRLAESLRSSADSIDSGVADVEASRAEAKQIIDQAKQEIASAKTGYDENIKPLLDDLSQRVAQLESALSASTGALSSATDEISGSAGSVAEKLSGVRGKLFEAADSLDGAAAKMSEFSAKVQDALSSSDMDTVKSLFETDIDSLAASIAAPVGVERHAMFASSSFGSAMSPLYTTLALWIGALLICVAIKVTPSGRSLEELDNPSLPQLFLGRFGIVSVISLMQSTLIALGNMLFLGIEVQEPLLYMVCFWTSGLVFSFIIYSLVASMANFGKAIGVVLLIVQVSGGGGSFPLQLFPQLFQQVSPFLPVTHSVNAMRAAMFGVFQGDFWIQIGELALFVIPFAILGLVLRNPFMKLVDFFVEQVEKSKLA